MRKSKKPKPSFDVAVVRRHGLVVIEPNRVTDYEIDEVCETLFAATGRAISAAIARRVW
jgi:hypothetical protein